MTCCMFKDPIRYLQNNPQLYPRSNTVHLLLDQVRTLYSVHTKHQMTVCSIEYNYYPIEGSFILYMACA